jgi:hypothetical protein
MRVIHVSISIPSLRRQRPEADEALDADAPIIEGLLNRESVALVAVIR